MFNTIVRAVLFVALLAVASVVTIALVTFVYHTNAVSFMHLDNRCNSFWAHGQRARMEEKNSKNYGGIVFK